MQGQSVLSKKQQIGILILMILLSVGYTTQSAADYRIFVAAGRVMIDEGNNPYLAEDMVETEPDGIVTPHAQYRYAPIFGISLYPFSLLPKPLYIFIWLLLNAFLLVRTLLLFRDFFPKILEDNRAFLWVSGISILLCVRIIGQNFELGQTTIILIFLSFYSLYLAKQGKDLLAGLMLSMAIVTKIMPVLLIPYFLYRANYKTPLFTLAWTAFLVFIPTIFVGWEYNSYLIREWIGIINPANSEYTLETKSGIYNLSAFIYSYFTEMPDDKLEGKRNILSISYETAGIITNIVRGAFILLALYFTKWNPFNAVNDWKQLFYEFGYICLAFPLIFPAQNKYSFYYIFPVIFYLCVYFYHIKRSEGTFWKAKKSILIPFLAYFVLTNLSSANILGKELYDLSQFYKIMTFGILALLITYIQVKPAMLNGNESTD